MRPSLCWLLVLAIACGGKKTEGGGSGTGTGSAPVAKPRDPNTIEIFVDGTSVAQLPLTQTAAWPRLDGLLSAEARRLGTWESIAMQTGGGPVTLAKPAQLHPDKVPVLFPGKDGKAAFGMFDAVELAKKGEPGFVANDVREIRIVISKTERGGEHQGSTGEAADPTKLVLKIQTPAGDKQLTGPEILKLPRESQPNNEDTKGWRVTQFLEAAGVTSYQAVTLVDANGTTLPLEKKDLDPATSNPFVKLNKQGSLRFRMFTKQGDGWAAGADLRSLVSIQVK